MNKMLAAEQAAKNSGLPVDQNVRMGSRMRELDNYGVKMIQIYQPAGSAGVVTPAVLGATNYNDPSPSAEAQGYDPDLLFDFEVMEIQVRTETSVASGAVTVKNGSNAISEAIVSAVANTLTLGLTINVAYNKFYPKSQPAAYAASPLTITDSGGATAPQRTVSILVRKI